MFAEMRQDERSDRIPLCRRVNDADWRDLLSGAEAFVYPTLYEGFGLPPLEAMGCCTPVVTSAIPAITEWIGDAALTFQPTEMESMVDALARIRQSPDLREHLTERGARLVTEFTWSRVAKQHVAVYRAVAGVRPPCAAFSASHMTASRMPTCAGSWTACPRP